MSTINVQPIRSPHIARLLCAAFLLLSLLPISLFAQSGSEGDLYFPPKLKVEVSTDEFFLYEMMGIYMEDEPTSPTMDNKIVFTKQLRSRTLQLLPMVFFDQASSTIPQHYQTFVGGSDANKYSIQDAPKEESAKQRSPETEIAKYYEVLNIIGRRMQDIPSSHIKLEGGYSTEPGENETVGKDRADVVKEYLVNVWQIKPERITVLPPRLMCSPDDHALKQEEARRVAIHTMNRELIKPVEYQNALISSKLVALAITIDPQMPSGEVSEARLILASGDDILSKTTVPINADSAVYRFTGYWKTLGDIDAVDGSITAQAVIVANDGKERGSNIVSIPIVVEEVPSEQSKTEVVPDVSATPTSVEPILFFESSDSCLSALQEQVVEERIADIIEHVTLRGDNRERGKQRRLILSSLGETSDNREADVGKIQSEKNLRSQLSTLQKEIAADPTVQPSLYIIPEFNTEDPQDRIVGNTLMSPKGLDEAWYGNRAEEVRATQREILVSQNSYREHLRENIPEELRNLIEYRAGSVEQSLRQKLDATMFDTIIVQPVTYRYFNSVYTPEERFYARSVSISIQYYARTPQIEEGQEAQQEEE